MTLPLLPYPQSLQTGAKDCSIRGSVVHTESPLLQAVAETLRSGLASAESGSTDTVISLIVDHDISHPEAYRLSLRGQQHELCASSPAGAFYGVQTLLQLAASGESVPELKIEDSPAYNWRGMHLDCSRHFFDVTFIKRYIDLLARHKMNRFHWHLCDDQGWRLQSARFPMLTGFGAWREDSVIGHTNNRERRYTQQRYGGFYTREQVAEVVSYAAERHIAVVPEIDIPGHAAALLAAYPKLSCDGGEYRVEPHFGIFPDVLCPSEETFDFLGELLAEVAQLFPFSHVHIGGDEVIKDQWRKCPRCQQLMRSQGIDSLEQLHGYFVSRVEAMINRLGRRAICWDDVMDGDIDSRTTIMCWNGDDTCRQALLAGHQAIATPMDSTYFDFYQSTSLDEPRAIHGLTTLRKVFDFDPLPAGVDESLRQNILGAQGNVWTEYLRDEAAVEYACLPRMSALAEVTWTGRGRNWEQFCERLPAVIAQLEAEGYRVARSVYKPSIEVSHKQNGTLQVAMDCEMPGMHIHYTTDGSPPSSRSPRYHKPLQISDSCIVRCRVANPENSQLFGEARQHLAVHKGIGRPVLRMRRGEFVPAPELSLLGNGCLGRERIFQATEWACLEGEETDIAVDLGRSQTISSVDLNFEAGAHRLLFFPSAIELLTSDNGSDWHRAAGATDAELSRGQLHFDVTDCLARYLRLRLENRHKHYCPQQRREICQPVHLDEIVIT